MKFTYSYTINISPFKKQFSDPSLSDYLVGFTKLSEDAQKETLQIIVHKLQDLIGGDWGAYVYEPTKRKDLHIHGLVVLDEPLTDIKFKAIKDLSNSYGNDQYNKTIYLEYCRDNGKHWREVYMVKTLKDQNSPPNSPTENDLTKLITFDIYRKRALAPTV